MSSSSYQYWDPTAWGRRPFSKHPHSRYWKQDICHSDWDSVTIRTHWLPKTSQKCPQHSESGWSCSRPIVPTTRLFPSGNHATPVSLVSPRFRLHDEIPGSSCLGPQPWRIRLTTNRTNKRSMVGDEIWALSCRKTSLAVPDVVTKRYVYLWLKRMHDAVCSQVAGLLCHNFFWKAITSPWSDEICPCRSRLAMPGPKHSLQLFQKCLWFSGSKFKDRPRWR